MSIRIALAGNPNCGKTTLFNALTGSSQYVGNWPGVTVEKKEGYLKNHPDVLVVDLPGIYSLSPYSLEEVVARNYLLTERPDVILNMVDGTNLERNLYLTTQLMELGIPVVIAINMMDVIEKKGDKIDVESLSRALRTPVVEISALKETGIEEATELALQTAQSGRPYFPRAFSGAVEHALAHIEEAVIHHFPESEQRWYAIKIFERDEKVLASLSISEQTRQHIEDDIVSAEQELDDDAESIIISQRYDYIEGVLARCYRRRQLDTISLTEKIDRVVTNRFAALPIFAATMFLVYYLSISLFGTWATDAVLAGAERLSQFTETKLSAIGTAPWLVSLIVDGIISGVGGVLSFLPQLVMLFFFLAFLEGCGYMSRIAFMMDRLFHRFGLSGKSIIPLLIGTGCSVPGIMASRTIESQRDRRMTIITTSFIPCGAKLPMIALIASALFDGAWWVAPSAYFLGIFGVAISGLLLKNTAPFQGEGATFVMELPPYHLPLPRHLLRSVWERSSSFIKKAGTIILLASIVIWIGARFGMFGGTFGFSLDMPLENSVLGVLGSIISVLFIPLGFGNSEAAIATLMGLVAKEEVVGVFSVLSFTGMTPLAGYSFLVFNLLCAPCFGAMGAIKQEMNSAKWTAFAILYQCVFAYAMSLMIYQFGSLFLGSAQVVGVICAILVSLLLLYLILRPQIKKSSKT
ncbi:MAG: ferrous iron transport protein B [Clostridia bacterium]|nr:ferrous iron transport protein B [Clostridia bacterium]